MSNPFKSWSLSQVQAHNAKVSKLPAKIETAASLLASMREREMKKKTQALNAANAKASHLETRFLELWNLEGGPELEREFRFHPTRKWRSDFAHTESRTLIECEGAIFHGRHTRGLGFQADAEKYFEAHIRGYRVVRLTPNLITQENVRAIIMRLHLL